MVTCACAVCALFTVRILIVVDGKYSINKYNRRQRRQRQRSTVQLKRPPHLYHMYMQTIDKQNDRLLSILVRWLLIAAAHALALALSLNHFNGREI